MNIGSIGLGDRPPLKNWEYANAAARTGATGFTADDIGKFARQTDNGSYWELTSVAPTWAQFGTNNITIDFAIGAEGANSITVSCQVQDLFGNNLSDVYSFLFWLAPDPEGGVSTTAPNAGVSAADSVGSIIAEITPDLVWMVTTDSNGQIDFVISDTTAPVFFLTTRLPDGTVLSSSNISFT